MSNLNGHYNVHDVILAGSPSGERIRGKLSDFKTPETAHLWRDSDTPPMPRKKQERTEKQAVSDAAKRGRGKSNRTRESLLEDISRSWSEYRAELESLKSQGWYNIPAVAEMTGAPILKIRRMYYDGKIKNVLQSKVRNCAIFVRLEDVEKLLSGVKNV